MLTQDEWDEAREYWENWLEKFEINILPVFMRRGYSKSTALNVYALACSPTTLEEEIDEGDEPWKTKQ